MGEKISWHPPDAALRPASHFECALRRRRKIGFCPSTARWLRVAMLGLSARPSGAPLSTYCKVPPLGERVQDYDRLWPFSSIPPLPPDRRDRGACGRVSDWRNPTLMPRFGSLCCIEANTLIAQTRFCRRMFEPRRLRSRSVL